MSPDQLRAVLYYDGDALNLRAFDRGFRQRFRILRCSSPEDALALLEQRGGELGVIIADLNKGDMRGVELLERARTLAPHARRFLVTAYAELKVMVDAVNRGQVMRYFVKPWEHAEMLAALEEALKSEPTELQLQEMERRMMEAERLATPGQAAAGIVHGLWVPAGGLSEEVAALSRNIARVTEYASKHLARDNEPGVAETVKDLPSLIGDMVTGLESLRHVVRGLLAQARGDETEQTAELSEVVSFAVKLARAAVRDRARLTSNGGPVRVQFGPVRLCQVLLNLIVNAARAMEGMGRQGRIDVKWAVKDHHVILTVSDNGRGTPAEQQEKLSSCEELVAQCGGKLTLSSAPGEGTDIEIRLPRAPAPRG